eukprot:gene41970-23643_t
MRAAATVAVAAAAGIRGGIPTHRRKTMPSCADHAPPPLPLTHITHDTYDAASVLPGRAAGCTGGATCPNCLLPQLQENEECARVTSQPDCDQMANCTWCNVYPKGLCQYDGADCDIIAPNVVVRVRKGACPTEQTCTEDSENILWDFTCRCANQVWQKGGPALCEARLGRRR